MPYGTVNADLMTTSDGVSSSGLYGFKNRIINGNMMVWQRGTTFNAPADGDYNADRWQYGANQSGKVNIAQSSSAPSGFSYSALVTSTSSYSIGASDLFRYTQRIEGFNTADLAFGTASASTVTLSFWVRSSLTGTFGGSLQNNNGDRSYPFTYTINSANTWEYETITIAGDTTGTWVGATNGNGLQLNFSLGAGSSRIGTAGAWAAAGYYGATGQTNLVATNAATWQIVGVQLEKGSTATSFDYRPFGTEELLCQRYYYKHADGSVASNQIVSIGFYESSGVIFGSVKFPVTMRAIPTNVSASGTNYYSLFGVMNDQFNSLSNALTSVNQAGFFNASEASGTAGQTGSLRLNSSSAFVAFSAEL
jgi:hypothetical protein